MVCSLGSISTASAAVITVGEQDFSDGDFLDNSLVFNAAGSGEAAPFDLFRGNDRIGDTFAATWSISFTPEPVSEAAVTLGLFDHDSAARDDQVASFTLDGFDLTAELNALLNGRGGSQLEYNVYALTLPSATLALLSDGLATFSLDMVGPSLGGGKGNTDFEFFFGNNGVGLDFSSLRLGPDSVAVPAPPTVLLTAFASVLLGLVKRSKRSV